MALKREEWARYRRQAEHTLRSAERDRAEGDHDWACFKAQQAAELGLKGYIRSSRDFATGHSVTRLLSDLGDPVPEELVRCAQKLDKVYIPARYPDAYDAGAPIDYFHEEDAREAIDCASRVLRWLDDRATSQSA